MKVNDFITYAKAELTKNIPKFWII
jgi:hypothetical protein